MGGMSNAGWYPDPGGAPGMLRYWDGTAWSPTVMPAPASASGPAGTGSYASPGSAPLGATGGVPFGARPAPAASGPILSDGSTYRPVATRDLGRRSRGWGWWLLIGAVLVALFLGGQQLLRGGLPGVPGLPGAGNTGAAGNPTSRPCPVPNANQGTAPPVSVSGGRVHAGSLSYPQLGSPWGEPEGEPRLTFARAALTQNVVVEPNYNGLNSWVASVLIGDLVSGDGNFSSKAGAEMVARCAVATFYSDALVNRDDKVSKAMTVDGKPAWMLETHLTFDIPRLQVKGETAIFVIVETGANASGIYYASIPDSRPELLTTARQLVNQLQVDA